MPAGEKPAMMDCAAMMQLELFILAGYGWFASRLSGRFARYINRTAGAMLVACGAGLALTSER